MHHNDAFERTRYSDHLLFHSWVLNTFKPWDGVIWYTYLIPASPGGLMKSGGTKSLSRSVYHPNASHARCRMNQPAIKTIVLRLSPNFIGYLATLHELRMLFSGEWNEGLIVYCELGRGEKGSRLCNDTVPIVTVLLFCGVCSVSTTQGTCSIRSQQTYLFGNCGLICLPAGYEKSRERRV
jgi:hypothetical protein